MQSLALGGRHGFTTTVRHRVAWPHPEWWALALSASAWLVIIDTALISEATNSHSSMSHSIGLLPAARDWLLMIVAMMVPLSTGAIRATADRSLWRRRHRAITGWLFGYLAAWSVIGTAVGLIATLLPAQSMTASALVVAIAFLLAAMWQVAPARALAFAQCHRIQPLAPRGWRADYDCMRYGWTTGLWCSMACGPLMATCWLAGHGRFGVLVMGTVTLIGVADRYVARLDQRLLPASMIAAALIVASTSW